MAVSYTVQMSVLVTTRGNVKALMLDEISDALADAVMEADSPNWRIDSISIHPPETFDPDDDLDGAA